MDLNAPKILLVDDDELNRRMMGLLISEKGYNYDIASNGIEAIEAMKSQAYDLVLMDLQMPMMDGFEATSNIRKWEAEKRHTPIIALTAMLFHDERQKCLSAGMDDCISKPFSTERLFRLIETYVNKPISSTQLVSQQETNFSDKLAILDVQDALPRFSRDVEIYLEFLNEFIDGLPERIDGLRANLVSGDFKTLADSAHNLKGISASLGAKQISYLSQKLDQKSKDRDPLVIQQILEEIEKHVLVFRTEAGDILSGFSKYQGS